MLTRLLFVLFLAFTTASLGACDSAEVPIEEPVAFASEDVVSELETEALLLFCEHARASLSEVNVASSDPEPMCVGEGLAARFGGDGAVETCEAARDACLEETAPIPGGLFLPMSCSSEVSVVAGLGSCGFSVAEFDACIGAILTDIEEIKATLQCDISNEEAVALEGTPAEFSPPECDSVEAACPSLFIDLPETH